VANSWQQTPDGYSVIVEDGMRKAVMTDFWAAVFNPSFLTRFGHQMMACLSAGAFVVAGVGAWWVLKRGAQNPVAKRTLTVGLVSGLIFSLLVMFPTGHHSAVKVAETQLEKFAAMEGVFETEKGAGLTVLGLPVGDPPDSATVLAIPKLLSVMAYGNVHAEVKGLNDFPEEDRPPVLETFLAFHLMVGLGMLLLGAAALGVFLLWRRKLFDTTKRWVRLYLLAVVFCSPLPVLANELGWMTAEVGRQPWVVYERPDPSFDLPSVPGERAEIRRLPGMRTSEAYTTTVGAGTMLFSLVAFTLLYILLTLLWASLMLKTVRTADLGAGEADSTVQTKQEGQA
jgi:cytochrome d ubiquinol oxidase subunit I